MAKDKQGEAAWDRPPGLEDLPREPDGSVLDPASAPEEDEKPQRQQAKAE